LVGERTGTTYTLGEWLSVRLMEAAPLTGGLRFELAEAGTNIRTRPKASAKPKVSRNARARR
jgi:ribonuclease R